MKRRLQALERAGVMVAYRQIPRLGHGFGLGTGTAAQGWIDEAVRFWERAASRGASPPPPWPLTTDLQQQSSGDSR